MALNKFMHPRNRYKDNPPDFKELAKIFPNFKRHVKTSRSGKPFVNFRNAQAVRDLTLSLLERDFQLKIDLPNDRLVPTLPLRINYLSWIEDLLNCLPQKENPHVLDIGCGSSCVYPLVGVTMNPNWTFIATEVDEKNYNHAVSNVEKNGLMEKIKVRKTEKEDDLLCVDAFDACMCNPPFFTDEEELTVEEGRPTPNSACSGSKNEIIGGDFHYAERMFNESVTTNDNKQRWYTTMLGKKSSFVRILQFLRDHDVKTVASTEFCQGRTMRWGVAWSFSALNVSAIPKISRKEKKLSFLSKFLSSGDAVLVLKKILLNLKIDFTTAGASFTLKGNIIEGLPNRKTRRLEKRLHEAEVSGVEQKLQKLENGSTQTTVLDQTICILKVTQREDGEVQVELTPEIGRFSDEINRLFIYLRDRLQK
ncbi:RNA N(6)-adenosine-methyltransferase mettl16-like [Clavelina lepadiformis]|uniref:RNA N(6)-adenosine-methyltransferase mettl16-like n=1 Tax=Clavelina lepadiformis TaxID=159417 RepID=UPI0040414C52